MDTETLVEVEHLTVVRGGAALLEEITLEVKQGSIHVLAGPNGAGKTTMLRAILGQVPFTGSIRCRWRRGGRIGYVPQTLEIDRELPMTVTDFLGMMWSRRPVCLGSGGGRAAIGEALEKVGLADRARRRLGVLSGGEMQRLLLAQALIPTPELLLLDEPTSGVDESGLDQIEKAIRSLVREQGVTALIVSHDFDHVRRLADRVTWINRTVRRTGTPAEVLES